jgi:hypothetical protein
LNNDFRPKKTADVPKYALLVIWKESLFAYALHSSSPTSQFHCIDSRIEEEVVDYYSSQEYYTLSKSDANYVVPWHS